MTPGHASLDNGSARSTASIYVVLSQSCFVLFLAISVALHPGFVLKANEGGMSDYGVHLKTALTYSLALGLAAVLAQRAARTSTLTSRKSRRFQRLLRTYGWLIWLTLISTYGYTLDTPLKAIHVGVGVVTVLFESATSLWMYRVIQGLALVVVVQLIGLILAAATFFGVLHVLFLSQILGGGAFAVLLVRSSRELT